MLIVNQEKSSVYNFKNIKSIDVEENTVNITDDILSNKGVVIGTYETEERAKEVLQEIVTSYKNWNDMKTGTIIRGSHPIYEMPIE